MHPPTQVVHPPTRWSSLGRSLALRELQLQTRDLSLLVGHSLPCVVKLLLEALDLTLLFLDILLRSRPRGEQHQVEYERKHRQEE